MSGLGDAQLVLAGLVLIAIVSLVVLRPLLAEEPDEEPGEDQRLAALQAAKEAKYREIRDAELDLRMGKLSEADHRAVDRELRAQAIEILRDIDRLEGRDPEGDAEDGGGRATEGSARREAEDRGVPAHEGNPPHRADGGPAR
ncbi:MAG TPA: hypothetical protein VGR10_00380 [Thermoleophilaceae bacterium]|nr:hypothetical protein [Thermoleophilaceae bacterium]